MPRSLRRLPSAASALLAVLLPLVAALLLSGHDAVVITHGVSMNPVYYDGDLVIVQRERSYARGDIVAYHRPDLDLVVLHRIVGGGPRGWTFQGDNNPSIDPTTPTQGQLIGRAVLHVPRGGTWLRRLTAPPLMAAYAFLLLLGGSAATRTRRQRRKDQRAMSPRHLKPRTTLGSLPPSLRPVAAGAAALGVAALALAGVAWSRPTHRVVPTVMRVDSSMRFSYAAQVPPSPAYDGTAVRAPQPVFRRLTNAVEVTYSYTGRSGELDVAAELSTASGWRTRLPLRRTRVGSTYDGVVHLDLTALQRRADAGARATGLPADEVSVAVVPQVSVAGAAPFTPRLELSLTDLVLKPTSELVATATTQSKGSRLEEAVLTLLGRTVTVPVARAAGALALAVAIAVAAVLCVIARLSGPLGEAGRIRARYGDLVLPVLPMVLAAGRPVVDLPDVDSLARLAERYGLLVLHWSRGGVDTYVVQDEGTTFRYRAEQAAQVAISV